MQAKVGDLCNFETTRKDGTIARQKGIMIDRGIKKNREMFLWLLVVYDRGDDSMEFQYRFEVGSATGPRLCGYTVICDKNLVANFARPVPVGSVDRKDLDSIMIDIFESPVSQRLTQFQTEVETQSFWTKFNAPKGMTVIGGCTHKL